MPQGVDRNSQALVFQRALQGITVAEEFLLQVIHDLRRVSQLELSRYYHAGPSSSLILSLNELHFRKLVFGTGVCWEPTWLGDGAANWRQQLLVAEETDLSKIPKPRLGENGQLMGPPCRDYRPAFFAPGYCWCCRRRSEHVGEYLKAAEKLLLETN